MVFSWKIQFLATQHFLKIVFPWTNKNTHSEDYFLVAKYEIKKQVPPNWERDIYVSVRMCRCWKGEYMHSGRLKRCGVGFFLMRLQMFHLICSRNRRSLSLLLTVTLLAKWIDGKFFTGQVASQILCFLLICIFLYIHFASVLGRTTVSERVNASRRAKWQSFQTQGKGREFSTSSEPLMMSMWEWGSSNLTLVIRDVGFSIWADQCSSC